MARYCTQGDLERALGGAAVLVQLLDKDQDGLPDPDAVNDVLDAGTSEIASYIQRKISLDAIVQPYPLTLVFKTSDVCAFHAWARGSERQAAPPNVAASYDAAIRWAINVGDGIATIGEVVKATLDPPAKLIDHDPNAIGMSIAGFKRGFR